jgi:hypothetical protein
VRKGEGAADDESEDKDEKDEEEAGDGQRGKVRDEEEEGETFEKNQSTRTPFNCLTKETVD